MQISVHPEAATRAEQLAALAIGKLSEDPLAGAPPDGLYAPDLPIKAHIERSDVRGPFLSQQTDRFGRGVSRTYVDDQGALELSGEGYGAFMNCVRTLHRQAAIRNAVSESTVADVAFRWICEKKRGANPEPMVPSITAKLGAMVRPVEVVLPVFGLHVEQPVRIGNVVLEDLTAREMDAWRLAALQHAPDQADGVNQLYEKLRGRFQGRAVARYAVAAEPDYAVDRGTDEAELSLAILRLASVGAFVPERATLMALAGRELVPRTNHIVLGPNASFAYTEGLVHSGDFDAWVIRADEIRSRISPVIGHWSALMCATGRTELQETALRSVLLYSRATRHRNISEKLIHIFSAVESLLLRNDSEPISSALADRLAFAVGTSADERSAVAKNLRQVYGLRSRFVHHGVEAPPEGEVLASLERFLVTIAQLFINLHSALVQFKTRDEYLDSLDRLKYA